MPQVVLIVLNNFKNDSRVLKEAISLQKKGYNVKVVGLWEPGLREEEIVSGVPVHRMKLFTKNWPKNKLIQLIKYLEFSIKFVSTYRKADIFHCNDLETLPIGVFIKRFFNKKAKIVYDAHEYETEIAGLSGIQKKLTKFLEKILINYSEAIITVSESIANEYKRIYNIRKPHVILNVPNYCKINTQEDLLRKELEIKEGKKIFLYQGGLSSGRGIELILDAFGKVEDNRAVVVFMGYGPLKKLIEERAKKNKNIYFLPAVPPEKVLNYTASANYGISLIENICLSYYYCLPNKLFEYIMAEIPVIVSNLPEQREIVEKYNIGFVVKDFSVEELVKIIEKALDSDKESFRKSLKKAKKVFNWEKEEEKLWKIYYDLK